jgi:hypothetical protein
MLALMLMRVHLPFGARIRGKPLATVRLSFMERAVMHRVNIYAIGIVLLLTSATGILATSWEMLIVLVAIGIVCLPVRYEITSDGIAVNNVVFRPWSELRSFEQERRRIRMEGAPGTRPLVLPLLAAKQDAIVAVLRRHLSATAPRDRASLATQARRA